jgi:nucleotide-binding universal stress UspA family protein
MLEVKKILFPCDFTENSTKILPYVFAVSDKWDSTIYLLHITQDLLKWGGFYIPHPSLNSFQRELLESAEKAMDKFCEDELPGRSNYQKMILPGEPAVEILKVIESEAIDLVIMGTHGRKGLEHTIFGSVAENVVKKSSAPVLVINPHKLREFSNN